MIGEAWGHYVTVEVCASSGAAEGFVVRCQCKRYVHIKAAA